MTVKRKIPQWHIRVWSCSASAWGAPRREAWSRAARTVSANAAAMGSGVARRGAWEGGARTVRATSAAAAAAVEPRRGGEGGRAENRLSGDINWEGEWEVLINENFV